MFRRFHTTNNSTTVNGDREDVISVEVDPIWLAASVSYYTKTESDALFATGTPVYVESDPIWVGVSTTVTDNAAFGATAYGWGDHSTNSYIASGDSVAANDLSYTGQIYQASAVGQSFVGATIVPDANDGNMQSWDLTNSVAMAAITNVNPGSTFQFRLVQDATGSRVMSFDAAYKWAGGTTGILSTAGDAIDLLTISVWATNELHATITQDIK